MRKLRGVELSPTKALSELCKRSLYRFLQEFWGVIIPEEPVYNWHVEYLCDELQDIGYNLKARNTKKHDLLINIPPGTTKSTICSVMFPAWLWAIDPTLKVITASYSGTLSTDLSVKSRDLIKSDKYIEMFPDVEIKKDSDNKTFYENELGGARIATSVTGSITGQHAHIIIIDDPLNPKEAASEAERHRAIHFYDQTINTRKIDKKITPTITIMQRLHESDPSGHLLGKKNKPKHINLPAELTDNVRPIELKEYYIDGLLDPIRIDRQVIEESKDALGSYGYSGQFMQEPTPEGGEIWQKWFIEVDDREFPDIYNMSGVGTDWDLAYTKDDTNSASACVSSGKINEKMYIFDIDYRFLEFPDLINFMKSKKGPHYIEAKATGKSAKQTLLSMGIPSIEVNVKGGDKVARARMSTPFAESGLCYIKKSLADMLYNDSKQGIIKFPNNTHDDLADAVSQAIQRQNKPAFSVV